MGILVLNVPEKSFQGSKLEILILYKFLSEVTLKAQKLLLNPPKT